MKMIILLVLALCIATGLAYLVHEDPGYALLGYGDWSIETSLALLLFGALVLFGALYVLLRSLSGLRRMPGRLCRWNRARKSKRSQKELVRGLIDSAEGNWRRSEKLLAKHASQSETPLLNYLSAAHAAQSQGAYDRRDEYLLKAGAALPDESHAIHLTRAKLQLAAGQFEEAVASLKQLQEQSPHNAVVLTLLMRAYQQMGDWMSLRDLLPSLRRNNEISDSEWKPVEHQVYSSLLQRIALTNNVSGLHAMWESMPVTLQTDSEYLQLYVGHLIRLGASAQAEQPLAKALGRELNDDLVLLYSRIDIEMDRKVRHLEDWSRKSPNHALVSGVLGGLYAQQDKWDKARTVLEHSISLKPTAEACFLLGKLWERRGDMKKAARYYREGLELVCDVASPAVEEMTAATA